MTTTTINNQIKIVKKVFDGLYFLDQDYRFSREKLYNLAKKDEKNYKYSSHSYYQENYNKRFTLDFAAKFWTVKHIAQALTTEKPKLKDIPHLRDTYVLSHIIVDKYGKGEIKKLIDKKDLKFINNLEHTDFKKEIK